MKKYIVTTTINPVTEAIEKFQKMSDWHLIVVLDKKSPPWYKLSFGTVLTCDMQDQIDSELSKKIGWNCIQRRNMGMLYAYLEGADLIALVDDDNIPLDNWGQNIYVDKEVEADVYEMLIPAFDPLFVTNYPHLWHRGFPIQWLKQRAPIKKIRKKIRPMIQANFWNGDPDIDAICRMEHAPECSFDSKYFPFSSTAFSPFNSQNTLLSRKILKDYFMFPHIGRMDDIWASYYVQALGASVVYAEPSVYQERNIHDLTVDFKNEELGYLQTAKLLEELKKKPDALFSYIPEDTLKAFELYKRHFKK